ncbi:MAG: chorismate mutase [Coriobacteriia bacterium]|nr:chorismate mutase [Coriobacteriia bacterium]
MVDISHIRKNIDAIDLQIRELLMQRMDCSYQVAQAKQAAGSTDIYRAEREQAILDDLGEGIPEERRAQYLAVVRKITETSRMYQYGLIYDWNEGIFDKIEGAELTRTPGSLLKVRLTRINRPNAMSSILSMVGDYGFNMELMELVEVSDITHTVTFDLTICGDITQEHMRKLVFQLSKESANFRILENRA